MYRFLVISSLWLLTSVYSYAVDIPTAKPPLPPLPNDASIEEHKPFIEKGASALPVTPEVAKTMKKMELPPLPKPIDDPATPEPEKIDPTSTAAPTARRSTPPTDANQKQDKTDALPTLPGAVKPNVSQAKPEEAPKLNTAPQPPATAPIITPATTVVPVPTPPAKQVAPAQPQTKVYSDAPTQQQIPPTPSPMNVYPTPPVQQPATAPVPPAEPAAAPVELQQPVQQPAPAQSESKAQPRVAPPKSNAQIIERQYEKQPAKPAVTAQVEPPKVAPAPKAPDPLQERFVRDEVLLLSFREDDMILGALSNEARFDQMEGAAYIRLYEKNIELEKDKNKARNNTWFILNHSKEEPIPLPKKYLFRVAVSDIEKSNLTDLRVLADNYPIIDMLDKQGNNLLHIASFNNNIPIAKWLIMRGADINMLNEKGAVPLDVVENRQYWEIYNLLIQAGAK